MTQQISQWLPPMLAEKSRRPIEDPQWLCEFKYDGVRTIVIVSDRGARLFSRNGNELTERFPRLRDLSDRVSRSPAVMDGELVAVDETGRHNFSQLMRRVRSSPETARQMARSIPAAVVLFDVLLWDGDDLRGRPLKERRETLKQGMRWGESVQYSPAVPGEQGPRLFTEAHLEGFEGIIAKRLDAPYVHGRSQHWVKIKANGRGRFLAAGVTAGTRHLLLGVYRGRDSLQYMGRVPVPPGQQSTLSEATAPLHCCGCAFERVPEVKKESCTWLKPELVCEVEYTEITPAGQLRHPQLVGLLPHARPSACRWCRLPKNRAARDAADDDGGLTVVSPVTSSAAHGLRQLPLHQNGDSTAHLEVEGQKVAVTNPDKVLWSKPRLTKAQVLAYYYSVREGLLGYIRGRPLVLTRYPDGPSSAGFYQKRAPKQLPNWVQTVQVPSSDGQIEYVVCNNAATLMWLVNLAAFEIHPFPFRWGESGAGVDFMVIDLDPAPPAGLAEARHAAALVEQLLGEVGVKGWVKSSGNTGFHVVVPLYPRYEGDSVSSLAQIIGTLLTTRRPDLFTLQRAKKQRRGRVYLDYLQNKWGRTIVAPYCLRPREPASVSLPLPWRSVLSEEMPARDELTGMQQAVRQYTGRGDLWQDLFDHRHDLADILSRFRSRWP